MKTLSPAKGWVIYRRLLQASAPYWLIFVYGAVATLVMSLIDAGFTGLIKPIIDKGFIDRDWLFIRWLPLIIIVAFILRGVTGFISNYYISQVARRVVMDFRRRLFDHLLKLPAHFYDRHSSAHLLSLIIYNIEQVAQASSDALVTLLQQGSLVVGLLGVMLVVNWKLSLLFLMIAPFIGWVVKTVSRRLRRLSTRVQESVGSVTHVASEGIDAYKVIRLFCGQLYESKKFHDATRSNYQQEMKMVVTNSLGTSLVQLLIAIPIAIILFFATSPLWGVSAGSFASVVSGMIVLLNPLRRLTMMNSYIQKGIAGAESVFALLDEEAEKDQGVISLSRTQGHIEFCHVNFRYERSKKWVLRDICFTVEPGQTVALVGRSGSGKSTLINLLPRFYDTTSGEIKIDGIAIQQYCLSDLRRQFSLVSQHTALFNDSILCNIAYGQPHVERDKIIRIAEMAHAMEFIHTLPQGLDTVVGENGVLLSGGQRQRIAIARALFKDAPILILDEATSALDTQAERLIQQALERLMRTRTTLVIAHRLSTIENADWIIVLEEGNLVEMGTHRNLLLAGGAYALLHRMQFRETTLLTEPA